MLNPSDWMEEKVSHPLNLLLQIFFSKLTYDPESGQNLFPIAILLETQSSGKKYKQHS